VFGDKLMHGAFSSVSFVEFGDLQMIRRRGTPLSL
jgi:hypothetical protein